MEIKDLNMETIASLIGERKRCVLVIPGDEWDRLHPMEWPSGLLLMTVGAPDGWCLYDLDTRQIFEGAYRGTVSVADAACPDLGDVTEKLKKFFWNFTPGERNPLHGPLTAERVSAITNRPYHIVFLGLAKWLCYDTLRQAFKWSNPPIKILTCYLDGGPLPAPIEECIAGAWIIVDAESNEEVYRSSPSDSQDWKMVLDRSKRLSFS